MFETLRYSNPLLSTSSNFPKRDLIISLLSLSSWRSMDYEARFSEECGAVFVFASSKFEMGEFKFELGWSLISVPIFFSRSESDSSIFILKAWWMGFILLSMYIEFNYKVVEKVIERIIFIMINITFEMMRCYYRFYNNYESWDSLY